MLARPAEPANRFTRRDAGRLIAGVDPAHRRHVGDPGPRHPARPDAARGGQAGARQRPGAAHRQLSERRAHGARARRPPGRPSNPSTTSRSPRGASVAAQQLRELDRKVAPIDAAFAEGVTPEDRASILADTLAGDLGTDDRATLLALDARPLGGRAGRGRAGSWTRWSAPSSATPSWPRSATAIQGRFAGDLTGPEAALAAALIRPLIVPNSSFSAELTEQARSRAAEGVEDVVKAWQRGETIVRSGDRVRRGGLRGDRPFRPQRRAASTSLGWSGSSCSRSWSSACC